MPLLPLLCTGVFTTKYYCFLQPSKASVESEAMNVGSLYQISNVFLLFYAIQQNNLMTDAGAMNSDNVWFADRGNHDASANC